MESLEFNKSYFAVIPADVRYDRDLKDKAKLLYAEITSLCNDKGYCWATNNYFAELYDVSKETISRLISNLKDKGYIRLEFICFGKQIKERRIYISKNQEVLTETSRGIDEKINRGIDENVKENNKLFNNKINNNILSSESDETVDKSVDKFKKCSKTEDIELNNQIIDYLNKKCNTNYKSTTTKTKNYITARINEGYSLDEFKKVIDIKADEWLNNFEMAKYLRPETLFGSKFESYLNQKPVIKQAAKQQKPANKFHNFDQKIAGMGENKLEEMVRKRWS